MNLLQNFVMASLDANQNKGSKEPTGRWEPFYKFSAEEIAHATLIIDKQRWLQAEELALEPINNVKILRLLIRDELRWLRQNFKFYPNDLRMVA